MTTKRWIIYPKKSGDIIKQLLINRDIDPRREDQFLNPDFYKGTFDPLLMSDMKKAVQRIKKAVENKEKIGIFADYDADGVPGAAILTKLFNLLKIKTAIYIPTRKEGYGLNEAGIRFLKENDCQTIITVDLGIVNNSEVKLAKELGMDVIVTDHHEIQQEKLPKDALAIIHPRLAGSKYPNPHLSGGAVAWKFAWAVLLKLKGEKYLTYAKWWLDLAAITLVCDNMLLTGEGNNLENRVLIKYGIDILSKTKNKGLKELYQVASIDAKSLNTYTIGFQIGPRINAPGRLDHAGPSYYLLTTEDKKEAKEIALNLNEINIKRQKQLDEILGEAKNKVKREKLYEKKIILLLGKKWTSGIIGLVAGKLAEEYCRPVVVFRQHDSLLYGSARSIAEFNIMQALKKCQKLIIKFGGHKAAAGITIEKKNYSAFCKKLEEIAQKQIKDEDLIPKIKIDAEVASPNINFKLFSVLKKFEPFGIGNPRPVFLLKDAEILEKRMVGKKEKHLKMELSVNSFPTSPSLPAGKAGLRGTSQLSAIGFDMNHFKDKIEQGDKIDIVFTIDENIWNGNRTLQLKLIDLRKIS